MKDWSVVCVLSVLWPPEQESLENNGFIYMYIFGRDLFLLLSVPLEPMQHNNLFNAAVNNS